MDVEARKDSSPIPTRGKLTRRLLLVALNCGMLALGTTAGPLLTRLYYDKGGDREWLSAWLQSGGWPLLLVPVAASYAARRARDRAAPLLLAPPRVLLAAAGLGVATGADNFIYAYSLRYLPVSTSAILLSTQLAFTVFFAFLIVRQRLTAATVNAVALLTAGAVRAHPAAGRARVQAGRRGRRRRPRRDVRAGDGDAAGDGLLRHRVLHRRHGHQQGLPGACPCHAHLLLL